MGNRKQPFGYRVVMGEIALHPQEAKLVEHIFRQYLAGATYNTLVEELREQSIPYDEGKVWNKNMVARILEDSRYTGERGYPPVIDREALEKALEKAAQAEGVVLEVFHLLFEAGGDLLAIVLLELVGVEVDVQLADGVVAVRREGHVLADINGRGAVGERPATCRNDRHCGDGNEDLSGIVLFHFRILLCIIDCAAAVGAESDAVLDFFTAMCADHGVFPPVL